MQSRLVYSPATGQFALGPTLMQALLGLTLAWAGLAQAADVSGLRVASITLQGQPATSLAGVSLRAPGQAKPQPQHLATGQVLPPGTEISLPSGASAVLLSRNDNAVTLFPGASFVVGTVTEHGESHQPLAGKIEFQVRQALNFCNVSYNRFTAAVKGTVYSVEISPAQQTIEFHVTEGEVEVDQRLPLRVRGRVEETSDDEPLTVGAAELHLTDSLVSGERRKYALKVESYLKEFGNCAEVETYFYAALAMAERSSDGRKIHNAVINLMAAYDATGQAQSTLDLAQRCQSAARSAGAPAATAVAANRCNTFLGNAYQLLGRYRQAIESFEKVLETERSRRKNRTGIRVAIALNNLVLAYRALGELDRALALLTGPVEPSQALPASQAPVTALSRIAAASRPVGTEPQAAPSGFRLMPTGESAVDARVALAGQAELALDLQLYHLHRDQAGLTLLRELRGAAARGVRVRLLVDDFYAAEIDDLLRDLAAHAGVQVRLFNPLPLRWGAPVWRLLASPGDFELHNHRMHNKLFVADNTVAIFGGRNIADKYFMGHALANFIDMDLLATGAVVQDLSAVFDRYWNSDAAWPVSVLLGVPAAAEAQARLAAAVQHAAPVRPALGTDPLGQTAVQAQLDQGRLALHCASARFFADSPDKVSATLGKAPTEALRGLLAAIATARREVHIVSPYFVPGNVGLPMMREAARHGVQTVLITNSLGSTDEPLVHDKYSAYRVEMLRIGVQIHEFSPALTRRSMGFSDFGRSTPRLHAKVAMVDQRLVRVGSVNLDGRSAVGNTEMGGVIDSPALATKLKQLVSGERLGNLYRLSLLADGSTVQGSWPDGRGGSLSTTDEPESSPGLRFKLRLQSLVVDERLL